jgi:peroxin-14
MTENNENNTVEENATATTTIREDLVSSAVNFLKDPKVQNSAIEKRLDFLKNKGLTQEEIDQALSRANVSPTSTPSAAGSTQSHTQAQPTAPQTYTNTAAPVYSAYPVVQEQYSPSWKDYFITSAVAGAIGYGLYTFCSNVLGPVVNWPSEETLAEEKQRLDTQFDKAFEAIENMRSETATVLNTVQEQTNTINQTLDSLTNATQALKSQDEARNVDVDRLSDELDQIRKLVPEVS